MPTIARHITARLPIDTSWIGALLCGAGWHRWARWELLTAQFRRGRSLVEELYQVRECTRCNEYEGKHL